MPVSNKGETPELKAAWRFFKVVNDLKLANIFGMLWNVYPVLTFMERRNHARLQT
jgi:hypothetical protein